MKKTLTLIVLFLLCLGPIIAVGPKERYHIWVDKIRIPEYSCGLHDRPNVVQIVDAKDDEKGRHLWLIYGPKSYIKPAENYIINHQGKDTVLVWAGKYNMHVRAFKAYNKWTKE